MKRKNLGGKFGDLMPRKPLKKLIPKKPEMKSFHNLSPIEREALDKLCKKHKLDPYKDLPAWVVVKPVHRVEYYIKHERKADLAEKKRREKEKAKKKK